MEDSESGKVLVRARSLNAGETRAERGKWKLLILRVI